MFPSQSAHPAMPPGRLMAALAAIVLVLAACSGSAGPSPVASSSTAIATVAPTATPVATPTATPVPAFPATLKDDEGTSVTIASEPKRIVSLTPATTEILFGLGAGDRVVATDDGSDYPAAAANLKHVATFSSVDTEQVVQLGADLVVAGGLGFTPADAITKLRSLKIPVLVIYAPSVDGVLKDIALIGDAVGAADEAKVMTDGMSTQLKAISDAAAARATTAGAKPRVYYEIGYTDTTGQIYAPADKSFLAEMVTLAGAEPITTGDPNTYEIPLEKLIERDPQVIIIGVNPFYSPAPASLAKRPGWKVMTAIRDGQVRTVKDTEITRPGPRLVIGLRALALGIWPDIQLPPAS